MATPTGAIIVDLSHESLATWTRLVEWTREEAIGRDCRRLSGAALLHA
jgi:hypothetical protein